jgi:hypothetical protein
LGDRWDYAYPFWGFGAASLVGFVVDSGSVQMLLDRLLLDFRCWSGLSVVDQRCIAQTTEPGLAVSGRTCRGCSWAIGGTTLPFWRLEAASLVGFDVDSGQSRCFLIDSCWNFGVGAASLSSINAVLRSIHRLY